MDGNKFDEYDRKKLWEARHLILKVYEYNYGESKMRNEVKRLETIISKIDYLIACSAKKD